MQLNPNVPSSYNKDLGRFESPDGKCGEFRYFGWDYNGNLYPNLYFKNDVNGHLKNEDKQWVYMPWLQNISSERKMQF